MKYWVLPIICLSLLSVSKAGELLQDRTETNAVVSDLEVKGFVEFQHFFKDKNGAFAEFKVINPMNYQVYFTGYPELPMWVLERWHQGSWTRKSDSWPRCEAGPNPTEIKLKPHESFRFYVPIEGIANSFRVKVGARSINPKQSFVMISNQVDFEEK